MTLIIGATILFVSLVVLLVMYLKDNQKEEPHLDLNKMREMDPRNAEDAVATFKDDWAELFRKRFWILSVAIVLFYINSFLLSFAFLGQYQLDLFGTSKGWFWIAVIAIVLSSLFSFQILPPDKHGMLIFAGKIICPVRSGPVFAPRFLFLSLASETKNWKYISLQGGGVSDNSSNDGSLLRVTFVGKDQSDSEEFDILEQSMEASVRVSVRFRIKDGLHVAFIRNTDGFDAAANDLRAEVVTVVERLASTRTAREFQQNFKEINEKIENATDTVLSGIGLDTRTLVQSIEYPQKIVAALEDLAKSRADAKAQENRAEGEKRSETLTRQGRAEGMKTLAEELGVSGQAIIDLERQETVGGNANKTVITSANLGMNDPASTGAAIAAGADAVRDKEEK